MEAPMGKVKTKPYVAKTLTSYRRWILRAYNSESKELSDAEFCKQHRIKVYELRVWQELAGQELMVKLRGMEAAEYAEPARPKRSESRSIEKQGSSEKNGIPKGSTYSRKEFHAECAKIIELTGGGRVNDRIKGNGYHILCELARYRLLQKVASLSSTERHYRLFTKLRGQL
jgi:hypothetical protein